MVLNKKVEKESLKRRVDEGRKEDGQVDVVVYSVEVRVVDAMTRRKNEAMKTHVETLADEEEEENSRKISYDEREGVMEALQDSC